MGELAPVEQALTRHLEDVTGFGWSTKVPRTRPAQFGTVVRNGGPATGLAPSRPLVRVECWGSSPGLAWAVCVAAHAALRDLVHVDPALVPLVHVHDVEVTDPVNFPDTSSGMDRYQFLASLTLLPKE